MELIGTLDVVCVDGFAWLLGLTAGFAFVFGCAGWRDGSRLCTIARFAVEDGAPGAVGVRCGLRVHPWGRSGRHTPGAEAPFQGGLRRGPSLKAWRTQKRFELRSNDPTHAAMRLRHEWGTRGMGWFGCVGHPSIKSYKVL